MEKFKVYRKWSDKDFDWMKTDSIERLKELTTLLELFKQMSIQTSPDPTNIVGAAYSHLFIDVVRILDIMERNLKLVKSIHRDHELGAMEPYRELEGIMEMLDDWERRWVKRTEKLRDKSLERAKMREENRRMEE